MKKKAESYNDVNGLAPMYFHDLISERHTDYDLRDSFGYSGTLTAVASNRPTEALPSVISFTFVTINTLNT